MPHAASPEVLAIVPARDADPVPLQQLLADLRAQAEVRVEVLVVDQTLRGLPADLDLGGAARVRERSPARSRAWRHGLATGGAPWIAFCLPGTRLAADRLRTQLDAADGGSVELVTSDLHVRSPEGYARRVSPDLAPELPPLWEATALVRRSALEGLRDVAFWPVEQELYRRLRAEDGVRHVAEALVAATSESFEAAAERQRHDAELLRLAESPHRGAPKLTVLLATHERCDVLLECLEAYSRQLVAPGTFEIIVIDDGSTDGTREVGEELVLPVPFTFLHKEADGASRARILGMPHARGELVLFVNDDTIPFPDNVQAHLQAHRELEGQRAMVLGSFEQTPEHLENALMRLLERSHFVFDYGRWEPGQELGAGAFYTCHISVSRAAVEEAGGFDPDFSHYGCEDTDLGARLEDLGWTIHYRPECRAIHRHLLTFDALRRRQPLVARAHTRLFLKHPRLLSGQAWSDQSPARMRQVEEQVEPHMPLIESAGRMLSGLNAARIEAAGGTCATIARELEDCLDQLYRRVNRVWWNRGLMDGMELHGLTTLADTLARWEPELPELSRTARNAVLVRAEGSQWLALADAWMAREGSERGDADGAALVVLADTAEPAQRALASAVRRARRLGHSAPVAVAVPGDERALDELFASARAWIPGGGPSDEADRRRAMAAGADELALRAELPSLPMWPLATEAALRLLAWPSWDTPGALAALAQAVAPLAARGDVCLVLRHAPGEASPQPGLAELEAALAQLGETRLEVLLEQASLTDPDWEHLVFAADAVLTPAGTAEQRALLLRRVGRPYLVTAEDTALWLAERDACFTARIPVLQEEPCRA
ncbi:MAG: glycosyltransferase family 2 protein [Planctomycetota bacterium]